MSLNTALRIEMKSVSFAYNGDSVLKEINFRVEPDDYVLLLGANGSGKTTLLRVALGLVQATSGSVRLFGRSTRDHEAREQAGYVPQRAALSPRVPATVFEVVLAGRAGRGWLGRSGSKDRSAAMRAIEQVGLTERAGDRVGELSGGQQQRVLIARALANEPKLLILDEPTAGVDRASHIQFASVLRRLNQDGVAIVVAAHDLGAIGGDLTRVVALHQGHIDEIEPELAREQIGLFVEDHAH